MGTPSYMSPEQVKDGCGRAQRYFFSCVMLYEMVTGEKPFPGKTSPL